MKKTVMNHSLAKALMEASMEHFDSGGIVSGITNALTPTSGYQANLAPTQTSDYSPTISTASNNVLNGFQTSQDIQSQQQALARTLLAQSQGAGPNPALTQLATSTGQNAALQAALMAGQRGAGANPGLIARQVAMQGGNLQQQATGQASTLQAQQELEAQKALQQQQSAMAGENISEQGVNANLFGTASGAQNSQNNTAVSNYGTTQAINSGTALANAKAQQGTASGIAGFLFGSGGKDGNPGALSALTSFLSKGGSVPDHIHKMAKIYHPKFSGEATDFRSGGTVPGKAKVKGDSPKNDTVPAMVSPDEIVLPRSVTTATDAPQKAAEFVKHLQDKKKPEEKGYGKVAASKKSLKERVARLEKLYMGGAT